MLETFKRYDSGETISSIMNWLNEQGLINTRGQKMTFNSVGHMLHNRRYIGEFKYRDVIVPDGIPAIVPQDLFDRVQDRLAKNKKAPARHKAEDDYLLTTKLFCGYCGAYSIVGLTDVRLSKVNTAAVIPPDATMINKSTGERAIPGILLKINPDPKL